MFSAEKNIVREANVFLISETVTKNEEIYRWLLSLGVSEERISKLVFEYDGSDSELCCELAARRCYKSFEPGLNPNVTAIRENSEEYFENILKSFHGSVLAHSCVTIAIENISRVATHELVRHAAGTGISQESMRYVRFDEFNFVAPLHDDPSLNLPDDLIERICSYTQSEIEKFQKDTLDKETSFARKKALTSQIRRLMPNGVATGIVFTGNHRAWRNIIEQRANEHAEIEISSIIKKIADLLFDKYSFIYQDFYDKDGSYVPKYRKV